VVCQEPSLPSTGVDALGSGGGLARILGVALYEIGIDRGRLTGMRKRAGNRKWTLRGKGTVMTDEVAHGAGAKMALSKR